MSSEPDVSNDEVRLCELLDRFEQLRRVDPAAGVGALKEEAGDLYEKLTELVACAGAINTAFDEHDETLPLEIGPYKVESWLGSGLSGEVYRAVGEDGRPVAIKVLRPTFKSADKGLERFLREVRVVSDLNDPHTVRVLDHGEDGEHQYVVMELVDGGSLATLLAEIRSECGEQPGPDWNAVLDAHGVPPASGDSPAEVYGRRMAALFAPAARALEHAAQEGLVHRDLKPSNLLLTRDGKIRVADFGIAKIMGEEITSTLAYLGTPGFMSPEQARGESRDVDERTDVYGLGATLHRALTLRYPIPGETMSEMLAGILTKTPERLKGYPDSLADLDARCLEKDPDDRYQSLGALADDLERIAHGEPAKEAKLPAPRRARRFALRHRAAVGIGLVLVVWVLWWTVWPRTVEFMVRPSEARITLDGEDPGAPPWRLRRGSYTLRITLDGFEIEERKLNVYENRSLEIALIPKTMEALQQLAKAYDTAITLADFTPVASRGTGGEFPDLDALEPNVFEAVKALQDGRHKRAYQHLMRLPKDNKLTLRLKLQALDGMGLRDTAKHAELYTAWLNAR